MKIKLISYLCAGVLITVPALACTTILVGTQATSDGSMLIARNDDTGSALKTFAIMQHPRVVNSGDKEFKSNANQFTYPLPAVSLAYTALPRSYTKVKPNYSMEEVGFNESGVAISATETIFNSEGALKADPYLEESGINEDSIPSIILQSAHNAREGIMLLGSIIQNQGAAEGFGVAISDKKNGTWYLETASGHRWVAWRLPADSFFVSANQGRTQKINLNDTNNYMGSGDLIQFAIDNKLYSSSSKGFWSWLTGSSSAEPESFNFFTAYVQNNEHDTTYNYPRIESLEQLYTGTSYTGKDGLFPMWETPVKKLTVADVAQGLRLHYQDTEYDPYMTQNPKAPYRPASVMRAIFSHITQIRPNLPDDIAYVEYVAIGMPDLSIYIPFYYGLPNIPASYQNAEDGKPDNTSEYWKYRKLQALVMQNYPKYAPVVHEQFAQFESEMFIKQAAVEETYMKLYTMDPKQADNLLQQFTEILITQADLLVTNLTKKIATDLKMNNLSNEDYAKLIDKTEKEYHYGGA